MWGLGLWVPLLSPQALFGAGQVSTLRMELQVLMHFYVVLLLVPTGRPLVESVEVRGLVVAVLVCGWHLCAVRVRGTQGIRSSSPSDIVSKRLEHFSIASWPPEQ